jgi:hypothetical protein
VPHPPGDQWGESIYQQFCVIFVKKPTLMKILCEKVYKKLKFSVNGVIMIIVIKIILFLPTG